jgi:hypothetical protein
VPRPCSADRPNDRLSFDLKQPSVIDTLGRPFFAQHPKSPTCQTARTGAISDYRGGLGMSVDIDDTTRTIKAYDEVCRAYERIDDFRAKLLGALPVVSGVGLFVLLGNGGVAAAGSDNWKFLTFAGSFGTMVTIGLLLYEQRGIQYCIRLTTVAQQLESKLGVRGRFTSWPHSMRRLINEPTASGIIYSSVVAAWVFVAISKVALAGLFAALLSGSICFFATRAFYWWVTLGEEIARGEGPTQNIWYRRFAGHIDRRVVKP